MTRIERTSKALCSLFALSALALCAPATAQEEPDKPAPRITLEEILVEPQKPAADTLCRLRVKIGNRGSEIGSQLGFEVKINGQELGVYRNQLFMYPVDPGTTAEIQLYNFWSTETSRAMPADGKLRLEVTLKEARWFDVSTDDEGTEVWKPIGAVEGLPSSRSVVLEMTK